MHGIFSDAGGASRNNKQESKEGISPPEEGNDGPERFDQLLEPTKYNGGHETDVGMDKESDSATHVPLRQTFGGEVSGHSPIPQRTPGPPVGGGDNQREPPSAY